MYCFSLFYITVFYHRSFTHNAVQLKPWLRKFVILSGNWVTGMDLKAWSCMHRMQHLHSDTPDDPHSPVHKGVFGLLYAQVQSYEITLRGLVKNKERFTSHVRDLDFPVNYFNRKRLWFVPYLAHALIALVIGLSFNAWLLGFAYWAGIMSHPIQGWMVNALAHKFGYRNYDISDNSRNNSVVAWLVMGEGFQNNHHQSPQSAKFSVKWWEFDSGYALVRIGQALGIMKINENHS
jgi:stearoyl-CoA desaturase (delta-9 desaturase)